MWLCLCLHELFPHSNHQQILKHPARYAKSISQVYRALRWQETINPRLQPIMSNTSKVLRVKPGLVQNIIFIYSFTSDFALCVIALWAGNVLVISWHPVTISAHAYHSPAASCLEDLFAAEKPFSVSYSRCWRRLVYDLKKTEPSKIITVTCGSSALGGRFSF